MGMVFAPTISKACPAREVVRPSSSTPVAASEEERADSVCCLSCRGSSNQTQQDQQQLGDPRAILLLSSNCCASGLPESRPFHTCLVQAILSPCFANCASRALCLEGPRRVACCSCAPHTPLCGHGAPRARSRQHAFTTQRLHTLSRAQLHYRAPDANNRCASVQMCILCSLSAGHEAKRGRGRCPNPPGRRPCGYHHLSPGSAWRRYAMGSASAAFSVAERQGKSNHGGGQPLHPPAPRVPPVGVCVALLPLRSPFLCASLHCELPTG